MKMKFLIIFSIQFSSRNPEYVRDQTNLAERRKFEFDQIVTQEIGVLKEKNNLMFVQLESPKSKSLEKFKIII